MRATEYVIVRLNFLSLGGLLLWLGLKGRGERERVWIGGEGVGGWGLERRVDVRCVCTCLEGGEGGLTQIGGEWEDDKDFSMTS